MYIRNNALTGVERCEVLIVEQVVFFMCLWSIDTDVVLVAMSCFALLCQEADIRCGSDEITASCLLPNYAVFQEIAHTSTVLTTGELLDGYMSVTGVLFYIFLLLLCFIYFYC